MTAYLVCLAVLVAVYFAAIRPLKRRIAELEKAVAVNDRCARGQIRSVRARVEGLRKLSGEEAEAISERLDRIETRPTVVQ